MTKKEIALAVVFILILAAVIIFAGFTMVRFFTNDDANTATASNAEARPEASPNDLSEGTDEMAPLYSFSTITNGSEIKWDKIQTNIPHQGSETAFQLGDRWGLLDWYVEQSMAIGFVTPPQAAARSIPGYGSYWMTADSAATFEQAIGNGARYVEERSSDWEAGHSGLLYFLDEKGLAHKIAFLDENGLTCSFSEATTITVAAEAVPFRTFYGAESD